eukprot:CAMPEP_0176433162 /NCGR_PEP_ID=MMETSP0127-20121128/15841_1 /TAXON_ID=938130 /ORGANISM="Platyophrya macrostoma, Strain WH" /LENGTH=109 /DNA_ID=CAMNT_0017815503 /DNA_START=33 /DNA_END=362 /DNA_ORIENTATION=-
MSNGAKSGGRHCIILIQRDPKLETRTFTDHESVADAMRSLIGVFEDHLRHKRANAKGGIDYDSRELLAYLDSFHDLSLLAFDRQTKAYQPYDRMWIKNAIYQQLQRDLR